MASGTVYVYPKSAGGSVPTGAATEAKQDVMIAELQDIETDIEATNTKLDTLNATDFATEANQDVIISGLVSIDASLTSIDASLVSLDGKDFATSAKQDTQTGILTTIDGDTGNIATSVASIDTKAVQQTLGAGVAAGALRVVIASDQSNVPVDAFQGGSWTVAATQGGSWSVDRTWTLASGTDSVASVQSGVWSVAASQSGAWSVGITGTVPLPTGAATEAKQDSEISLLTTIDADTGNIATSVASIDTKAVQQDLNFGAAAGALRVAAVLGNASAVADFGSGTVSAQTLRVSIATDQSVISTKPKYEYVTSTRTVHSSTNVTTGAWVELIASTSAEINQLTIFSSSGSTLEIGTGAAASETRKLLVAPGGFDMANLNIPAGTRVSVRAVDVNATTGELQINYLG